LPQEIAHNLTKTSGESLRGDFGFNATRPPLSVVHEWGIIYALKAGIMVMQIELNRIY
jgi:hypothetical protein